MWHEWTIEEADSPIIATAIHNGHRVHEDRLELMGIDEATRLREEDPFTGSWTDIADTRVVVEISRFEVDLNRPRDKAVYRTSDDAWGLTPWEGEPDREIVDRCLATYDRFYDEMKGLIERTIDRHGAAVVLDLHSYNHHRGGEDAPPDDPALNPDVNVGTGSMNRERWAHLVDAFVDGLRRFDFDGTHLDVRENIRFRGGNFPTWIHATFPDTACALAVEMKKIYMDEWRGSLLPDAHRLIGAALRSTVPDLMRNLTS